MKSTIQLVTLSLLIVFCAAAGSSQTNDEKASKSATEHTVVARDQSPGNAASPIGGGTAAEEFVIGTGDVLAINVWKETEISRVVPVRSDGRISLPLIGELQAGGRTPKQLETEVATKLKDYVSEPEVTVIVQEIKSQKFNVLGMVMKPGSYTLTKPVTVLDAIALRSLV